MPDIAALFDPTSATTPMTFVVAQAQVGATIIFINESYINVFIIPPNGGKLFLPANDRRMIRLEGANAQPNQVWGWSKQSSINPANTINQVLAEIWYAWEKIVENYPNPIIRQANVGNTVSTSSVQTLSNEGQAANLLVIDIGDAAFAQLLTIFTDGHSTWAVDQAGVKHQVIKVQTSGNPLLLGQSGDITEVLGNLTTDGNAIITGTANITGALTATNASTLVQKANQLGDTSNNLAGGRLSVAALGDVLDAASSTQTYLKARSAGSGQGFTFQAPNGTGICDIQVGSVGLSRGNNGQLTVDQVIFHNGSLRSINTGTALSGTINHGLDGTPAQVLCTCDTTNSSATVGAYSYTSTQFGMTIGGSLDGRWWAGR